MTFKRRGGVGTHHDFKKHLQFLDEFKVPTKADRETLINIAHTSLATKLNTALAKKLAADVVDAVLTVRPLPPAAGDSDLPLSPTVLSD